MTTSTVHKHSLSESYAIAARAVARVLGGESLTPALAQSLPAYPTAALRGAAIDLTYSTVRAFGVPQLLVKRLLLKPITDPVLLALLYVTLIDLRKNSQRAYVLVDQAVNAAECLGRTPAKGLVNAVLRNYSRRAAPLESEIERDASARDGHPGWWVERVRRAHPERAQQILDAGNMTPPMTLRVNPRRAQIAAYVARLNAAGVVHTPIGRSGVRLERPTPVEQVPGFSAGEVSVQDAGAQLAAQLLGARDGERVLDACAAPGGKAGHVLELADVQLTALDLDGARCERIHANLARLGLRARVLAVDAAQTDLWWDQQPFDRIVLDVPCSASGVVRRHPDAKWLRRGSDVPSFARAQRGLLDAMWPLLRPGGQLLYATCSVFHEENGAQVDAMLARHPDARRLALPASELAPQDDGQLIPTSAYDGFYYAIITKRSADVGAPPHPPRQVVAHQ